MRKLGTYKQTELLYTLKEKKMDILNDLTSWLPSILSAVLFLLLAFIVASIAKAIVQKILEKTGVDQKLASAGIKDEKIGKSTDFIGQLVFLIVFLLFLPSALDRLNMNSVSAPITNAIESVLTFLPNLLAAGVVLFIGYYVAKVIRDILKSILNRVGLNKLQEKLGVTAIEDQNSFSSVIANFIYVLILIPIIIAVLEILGLNSIAKPASDILNNILYYIPIIFISVLLLFVGYYIAKIVAPLLENILTSIGLDRVTQEFIPESGSNPISISKIVSEIVRWIILVVFFVEAVNVLNLDVLSGIGEAIIAYLPIVISAMIIIIGGYLLANWIESMIIKHSPASKSLALISKVLVLVIAAFMTLSQLGFAQSIVNILFIIVLAALAIAFAISFGIGGRKFAEKQLDKLDNKLEKEENHINNMGE